ncbi:sulfatase [Haladaptatus salinisoli]|uniref:sulfatase n=1 Tax=Haladaptatus salinisoli TaxID=2884876 RepID=UPI001D0A6BF7|nr:sulfatase [Haladaptatus salinisoli]
MGQRKPNVLLVVVDACRADYVAPYADDARTPEIESFAEEATTFTRAVSAAPWTLPSVTSILTGKYPHEHGATSRGFRMRDGRTITDDLSDAGYRCFHVSPKTWIGDWLPQGRGFDAVREFTGPRHRFFESGADVRRLSKGVARGVGWYTTVARRALRTATPLRSLGNAAAFQFAEATGDAWLDDVRASERAARLVDEELANDDEPFFGYVHLMDPHLPFYVPDEFRTADVRPPGCETLSDEREYVRALMDDIWALRLGERRLSSAEKRYLRTRYEDEVAYADAVVGRIVDALEARGKAEDTMVVLTADHGEHLGERADGRTLVDHQTSVRLPLLRVPLLVRYPDEFDAGERDDLVQTTHVAETVRALAGPDYDPRRSLLDADRDERRETALAEYAGVVASHPPDDVRDERLTMRRTSAVAGEWKLDRIGDRWRAAEVDWDANEAREIDPEDMPEGVRETLRAAHPSDGAASGSRSVPDDVERNLRQLGYM